MRYIDKSVGDHEVVLRLATIGWPYHAAAWGCLGMAALSAVGALIYAFLPAIVLTATFAGVAGALFVYLHTIEIAITNRRVVFKKGVFSRDVREVSLTSLDETELEQGLLGRMTGYGRLTVWGSGKGELVTPIIQFPTSFRTLISDARARIIQPDDLQPAHVDADLTKQDKERFLATPAATDRHPTVSETVKSAASGKEYPSDDDGPRLQRNPGRAISSYE